MVIEGWWFRPILSLKPDWPVVSGHVCWAQWVCSHLCQVECGLQAWPCFTLGVSGGCRAASPDLLFGVQCCQPVPLVVGTVVSLWLLLLHPFTCFWVYDFGPRTPEAPYQNGQGLRPVSVMFRAGMQWTWPVGCLGVVCDMICQQSTTFWPAEGLLNPASLCSWHRNSFSEFCLVLVAMHLSGDRHGYSHVYHLSLLGYSCLL